MEEGSGAETQVPRRAQDGGASDAHAGKTHPRDAMVPREEVTLVEADRELDAENAGDSRRAGSRP